MSWDIFVQDLPASAQLVADIPDDFVPKSLGDRAAIISKIRQIAPMVNFSDPNWGTIDGEDFSIEVNIGHGDPVHGFALHIRGGDLAAFVVADILDCLGLRAIDSGTGGIFQPNGLEAGLRRWRAYRDRICNG